MPDYAYKATDPNGAILRGIRFAESESELDAYLKQAGLLLIEYKETRARKFLSFLDNVRLGGVRRRELVEFSNNMGVMIRAGVPVMRALDEIRQDLGNRYFKKVLARVIQGIEEGAGLHEAMAGIEKVFPRLYTGVIEIGENTGRLDTVFFDLAHHLKRLDNLIRETRKALIYPCFLLAAMVIATVVALALVFPTLLDMMKEFDVPLPIVTKVVMAISESLQYQWPIYVLSFVGLASLIYLARKNKQTRYYFDWCEIKLPGIKGVFLHLRLTFFMRYMAMLLKAGIDILRGIDLALQSVNNLLLQKKLIACKQEITEGSQLSDAFKRSRIIPSMVIRMVAVGEESGNLPGQMELVADYYNDELSHRIGVALTMLGPILVFFIALIILALIMGILLPLYDLVSQMSS